MVGGARASTGLRVTGGARPKARKQRPHEWTDEKKEIFLGSLAATCNVELSAKAAGMRPAGAYEVRLRDAAFRRGWALALREGYAKLELTLLERALNGTVKTRRRADGSTDETREYPNAVALSLLRMHRESVQEAEAEHDEDELEEVRERIARKLKDLAARITKEGTGPGEDGATEPEGGEG
jgi:hypothetical protein